MIMDLSGCPKQGWLYALQYVAYVYNVTANHALGWQTHFFMQFGTTPNILALLAFCFFEKVYYLEPKASFLDTQEESGYILGIAENVGDALTYWVLQEKTQQVIA